mgnify:CR=1 FL=1
MPRYAFRLLNVFASWCVPCAAEAGELAKLKAAGVEVDGVAKQDYWKVVDQCYLCDTCYMTKCPYVPPHSFDVDFPHLMLRHRAVRQRKGDKAGAAAILQPIIERVGDNSLYQQAQVLAQAGDNGKALDVLEKAFVAGDAGLLSMKVDPLLDPLHNDERFSRLLKQLGLA